MKLKSKIILICALAVTMILISVGGTLAYITSQDSTVNTFTVGKISLTLDEAAVDDYGQAIPGANRVKNREGDIKLIPSQRIDKDPTVTVKKGSEPAYVRMILTIHNESVVSDIVNTARHGLDGDYANLLYNWSNNEWVYETYTVDATANTISFEFRYVDIVDARNVTEDLKLTALFEGLNVPATLTSEDLENLEAGDFQVDVVAHAIQTTGFTSADEAWLNFDEQMAAIQ